MRNLRMILRAGVMLAFFILSGATWGATVLPVIPNQHLRGSLGVDGATSLTTLQVSGATTLTALSVQNLRYPATDGTAGQAIVTDGAGDLSFDNPPNVHNELHAMTSELAHEGSPRVIFYSDADGHIQERALNVQAEYETPWFLVDTGGVGSPGLVRLTVADIPAAIARDSELHTRSHTMTGTSDHTAGNWKIFYTNGSGQVVELLTGASYYILTGNGTAAAPSWQSFLTLMLALDGAASGLDADLLDGQHGAYYQPLIAAGTTAQYWRGDKSWQTLSYTNVSGTHPMTATHTSGNNKVFYGSSTGVLTELALGADGTFLEAKGTTSSPVFAALTDTVIPDAITVSSSGTVAPGAIKGSGTIGEAYIDPLIARLTDLDTSTTVFIRNDVTAAQTMIGTLAMPGLAVGESTTAPAPGQVKAVSSTGAGVFTSIQKNATGPTSQGPSLGTIATDVDGAYWVDDNNILLADGAYAYSTTPRSRIRSTGMTWTIPSGAVFSGVEITVNAKYAGISRVLHARVVDDTGVYLTADSYQSITTDFATYTFGGAGNLLGATQSGLAAFYDASKKADCGVQIYAASGTGTTVYVDWIKLKFYYSVSGTDQIWSAGTNSSGNWVVAKANDLTSGTALTLAQATRNATFTGTINTTGGVFEDTDAEDLVLRTNSQENQLVLNSTGGYVGIGTAAPSYALTVAGLIYATAGVYSATINYAPSVYATGTFVSTIPTVTYRSTAILGAMGLRNGAQAVNAGYNCVGLYSAPAFTEAGSDKHKLLAGAGFFIPTITNAGATVSHTANVYIEGAPSATGAAGNYALWVDAGNVRIDEDVLTSGSIKLATDGSGTLDINGTTRLDASGNATLGTVASGAVTITGAAGSPTTPANPLEISTAKDAGVDVNPSLKYYQADVTTADATVTTILTIPIPQYSVCTIQVTINGVWATDASKGAGYIGAATYTNQAGTATPIGTATAIAGHESDAAHDYTFAFSSGNALVRVTGKAATSMKWSATATRHIVGNGAAD